MFGAKIEVKGKERTEFEIYKIAKSTARTFRFQFTYLISLSELNIILQFSHKIEVVTKQKLLQALQFLHILLLFLLHSFFHSKTSIGQWKRIYIDLVICCIAWRSLRKSSVKLLVTIWISKVNLLCNSLLSDYIYIIYIYIYYMYILYIIYWMASLVQMSKAYNIFGKL